MSENVSFIQGSKENYNPSEMAGGVFFSKDTKEILLNGESYGNSVKADEEDITQEEGNLKLKDRSYDEANFSGKGYVILRKNIQEITVPKFDLTISSGCTTNGTITVTLGDSPTQVEVTTDASTPEAVAQLIQAAIPESTIEGAIVTFTSNPTLDYSTTGVTGSVADNSYQENRNILTQEMINNPNTVYEIRYDFDLNGQEITIPDKCVLKFQGGSISKGSLIGNNSLIYSNYPCLDELVVLRGTFENNTIDLSIYKLVYWFPGTWKNFQSGTFIPSTNSTIVNNLIQQGYSVKFPQGMFPFDTSIKMPFAVKNQNIQGVYSKGDIKLTSLIFPNSCGIEFGPDRYGAVGFSLKDINIESKGRCINFNNSTLEETQYPTFTESLIENVHFYSQEEDCIASDISSNMYKNVFKDIHFTSNSEHGFANYLGNLENIFINISDGWRLVDDKQYNTVPRYIFKNMSVILHRSNLTNTSIENLVLCTKETANQLAFVVIRDSNLESFSGALIYSDNTTWAFYIDIDDSNIITFTKNFKSDVYKAYFHCRVRTIGSLPVQINNQGTAPEFDFYTTGANQFYCNRNLKVSWSGQITGYVDGYKTNGTDNKSFIINDKLYYSQLKNVSTNYLSANNVLKLTQNTDTDYGVTIPSGINDTYLIAYDGTSNIAMVKYYDQQRGYYVKAPLLVGYSGTSSGRPTLNADSKGFIYYDTTLKKPIYWNGTTWIDADGNNPDEEQTNWALIE